MPDLNDLMKQAQQIQSQLAQAQEEAAKKTWLLPLLAAIWSPLKSMARWRSSRSKSTPLSSKAATSIWSKTWCWLDVNQGLGQAKKMMADEVGKLAGGMLPAGLKIPGLGG